MRLSRTQKIILLIVAAILFTLPAFSLELKEGRIKLILHENLGKFSLYYLSDIGKNIYTPLFLDQDPRTTSLSVISENKVYRMGESSNFRQIIESTTDGAKFIWRSSSLEVTEEFSFINSPSSPISNGVLLKITISNISEVNNSIGCRYIFDSYLGEDSGVHFETDTVSRITGETSYVKYNLPEYINSPGDTDTVEGFQIMLQGTGLTSADEVVFANWKRLNDSTWDYDIRSSRNFNLLPYSINDSGIAIFFDHQSLQAGATREITLALGAFDSEGFSASKSDTKSEIADVFNKTLSHTGSITQDTELSVQTDLLTINDLIKKINNKIDSGDSISQSEIDLMNQVISELNKRKSRYSDE